MKPGTVWIKSRVNIFGVFLYPIIVFAPALQSRLRRIMLTDLDVGLFFVVYNVLVSR